MRHALKSSLFSGYGFRTIGPATNELHLPASLHPYLQNILMFLYLYLMAYLGFCHYLAKDMGNAKTSTRL